MRPSTGIDPIRLLRVTGISMLAGLIFLGPARAGSNWPSGGVQVSSFGGGAVKVCADGAGGAFIAWTDYRQSHEGHGGLTVAQIYVQRLTAEGSVATGWPQDGVRVSQDAQTNFNVTDLRADGFGGALIAWFGRDEVGQQAIFVARVLSNGSIPPAWPAAGFRVCCVNPIFLNDPKLAPDGSGGAYVAWSQQGAGQDVYLQHITPQGTLAAGWRIDGIPIGQGPGFESFPKIIPAANGVFLAWGADSRGYVQRVTETGSIAGGWPLQGLLIHPGEVFNLNLEPDGSDGAVVSAVASASRGYVILVRRVSSNGQWEDPVFLGTCSGTQHCYRRQLQSTFDRAGGVVHSWLDEVSGTHVHIGRTTLGPPPAVAPGWPTDGVSLGPGWTYFAISGIAADGHGGAFLPVGRGPYGSADVRIHHVRADGSLDPLWGTEGRPVSSVPGDRWQAVIAATGPGEAVVVWPETNRGLYAQKVIVDPLVPHYTLEISTRGQGTVTRDPDEASYPSGAHVTLRAIAAAGHRFVGWTGSVEGVENPLTVVVEGNMRVNAQFALEVALRVVPSQLIDAPAVRAPLTALITLPAPHTAGQVLLSSLRLNGVATDETEPEVSRRGGSRDEAELVAKFPYAAVLATFQGATPGELSVRGTVGDVEFVGIDTVRVVGRRSGLEPASNPLIEPEPGAKFELGIASPARTQAEIRFVLPRDESIRLTAFDLRGRRVWGLAPAVHPRGSHRIVWDGRDDRGQRVPAGIYMIRLESPRGDLVRRVVWTR